MAKTQVCTKCKKEKSLNKFNKDIRYKSGRVSWCKNCITQARKDRRKWFLSYKKTLCCEICGYNKCPASLVFHHKNPEEKEYLISQITQLNRKKAMKEISKCQVLCSNCHKELHWRENHG